MKIHKIVLSGGPGSGKSTALDYLKQRLTCWGYQVFVVTETATELNAMGVSLYTTPGLSLQTAIITLQWTKEEQLAALAEQFAKVEKVKGVVILYDRGIPDIQSYYSGNWGYLLSIVGLSDEEKYTRYDHVFYLETAAKNKGYTTENNAARSESIEDAVWRCNHTMKSWEQHPSFHRFPATEDFSEKTTLLIEAMRRILGEEIVYEAEKKWLVDYDTVREALSKQAGKETRTNPNWLIGYTISQYYFQCGPGESERVRCRTNNANTSTVYTHTLKKNVSFGVREEDEREITREEFTDLKRNRKIIGEVHKVRTKFQWEGRTWELDIFDNLIKTAILEVELKKGEINRNIKTPKFIKIICEVTGEDKFNNDYIAQSPIKVATEVQKRTLLAVRKE